MPLSVYEAKDCALTLEHSQLRSPLPLCSMDGSITVKPEVSIPVKKSFCDDLLNSAFRNKMRKKVAFCPNMHKPNDMYKFRCDRVKIFFCRVEPHMEFLPLSSEFCWGKIPEAEAHGVHRTQKQISIMMLKFCYIPVQLCCRDTGP